jgi:hypothetical protein
MESPEFRQARAESNPEIARIFESHTREEREKRVEEWAMSRGVAHAIVQALKRVL